MTIQTEKNDPLANLGADVAQKIRLYVPKPALAKKNATLSPEQWAIAGEDVRLAVAIARPETASTAKLMLVFFSQYIADEWASGSNESVAHLLSSERVEAQIHRRRNRGEAASTLTSRAGLLRRLVAASDGLPWKRRASGARKLAPSPYTQDDLRAYVAAAAEKTGAREYEMRTAIGLFAGSGLGPEALDTEFTWNGSTLSNDGDEVGMIGWVAALVEDQSLRLTSRAWRNLSDWARRRTDLPNLKQARLRATWLANCVSPDTTPIDAVTTHGLSRYDVQSIVDHSDLAYEQNIGLLRSSRNCVQLRKPKSWAPSPLSEEVAEGGSNKVVSRAEIRRQKEAAKLEPAPPEELPELLADILATYTPRNMEPAVWGQIGPTVREVMAATTLRGKDSFKKRCTDASQFLEFAVKSETPSVGCFRKELIESYIRSGPDGLSGRSAATRSSWLTALARTANPKHHGFPPKSKPIPKKSAQPPYSAAAVREIHRIASTQPNSSRSRTVQLCTGLGLGAGASPADLRGLRRNHIEISERGILVNLQGKIERKVVVRERWEEMVLAGLDGLRPKQLVLGTKEDRTNITGHVFEKMATYDGAPKFNQHRMRNTWLVDLLSCPLPMALILQAAGLKSARTLTELIAYVENNMDLFDLRGES